MRGDAPAPSLLLWSLAIVLPVPCFVAGFSIGLYYLPAALALMVGAISILNERTA